MSDEAIIFLVFMTIIILTVLGLIKLKGKPDPSKPDQEEKEIETEPEPEPNTLPAIVPKKTEIIVLFDVVNYKQISMAKFYITNLVKEKIEFIVWSESKRTAEICAKKKITGSFEFYDVIKATKKKD